MPYRIAVNTRHLLPSMSDGISIFSYETLKRLSSLHSEHEFWFIFDRPFHKEFIFGPNVKPVVIPPPARHPVLWHLWFQVSLPFCLKHIRPHLFLSPDGFLPLHTNIPCIPVIHDLNFEHRPQDLPFMVRQYYRHFFPRFARKATRIVTVSEYSKKDIMETYGVKDEKIDICYNGVSGIFTPLSSAEQEKVRSEFTGGNRYFIMVGSVHPRKNVITVLKAFDQFRAMNPCRAKLIIAGPHWFGNREMYRILQTLSHRSDIVFTGRLPAATLHRLLASSVALVFVPHFEGFGIPVLEAMHCEIPVIASGVTSVPEVAGEAALYVNPSDAGEIAMAMKTLWNQEDMRQKLIAKGRTRCKMFSWDLTAKFLWESMENVLNSYYETAL